MSNIEQEIAVIKEGYADIVQQAEAKQVSNQAEVDETNLILKRITVALKAIEDKRLSFTSPLNESLKQINATFKQLTIPLNTAKETLLTKVMTWRAKEQKRIAEEQKKVIEKQERITREEERRRKIQEAHKEKGHQVSAPIILEKPLMPAELKATDTTQVRKQWTWDLIDISKVPAEYMMLNESKITQAVRSSGIREITGIKIYQKEIPVIR